MAVVLPSDDSSPFGSSSLRRSTSQTHFGSGTSTYQRPHSSSSKISDPYPPISTSYPDSDRSSAPSSPQTAHAESTDPSCASTPASNISIASDYEEMLAIDESPEDHFDLPAFAEDKFYSQQGIHRDDNLERPSSPQDPNANIQPATDDHSSGNIEDTSRPGTPECGEHAEDDTAAVSKPSRQVDYLSHDWREEDIWSSWRYIINRRDEFPNSARLENASWRTWMKAKNNLKTVSPETLNWLKDCDVTWLYGPLQSGATQLYSTQTQPSSTSLSKSDSLINMNKKPILKKRSMSELMLQRSLSASSLLKQAAAAVQAQETRGILRSSGVRYAPDYVALPFSYRRSSDGHSSSVAVSEDSSGITSPSTERKHIHFNEQVEQCIAVDVKGDEEEDMDMDRLDEDSDSDDGVMMKRVKSKKKAPQTKRRTKSKKTVCAEGKTIAMLPSTTLKYREDTPEPPETAMKHSTGSRSPMMSPSSSQETLRPAKGSSKFYFAEEGDDEVDHALQASGSDSGIGGLYRSNSTANLGDEPAGMRRTPSGMFMPCEDGEATPGDGLFGRVIDTVNTARDIAHVIWNVGWRK